jgi:macrolide-specific efflux system membrane fusion protein
MVLGLSSSPAVEVPEVQPRPDPGSPAPRRRLGRARRRWIALLGLGIAVAAAAAWWFLVREDSATQSTVPTTVSQVVEVVAGTVAERVSAEGTVSAAATDSLSFESSGTVTSVNVAVGDTVSAGQVVATLDSAELESDLAEAESDLADAEARLADDEDDEATDEQLAADEAAVVTAGDARDAAAEALEGAQLVASIDGVVTAVDLTVGEELGGSGTGSTTMTGSATGSGSSASSLGETTQQQSPGATTGSEQSSSGTAAQVEIMSAGRYSVEISVSSAEVDQVEVGQAVQLSISTDSADATASGGLGGFPGGFTPPGMGGGTGAPSQGGRATDDEEDSQQSSDLDTSSEDDVEAAGTVAEVSRVADASSGVATYAVTVWFEAEAATVWPGSTATAEILVSERTGVIQVDSRAVQSVAGAASVVVALDGTTDGRTEERSIEVGEISDGLTEVRSGLEAGEMVVVEAGGFGPPGMSVSGGSGPGAEMPVPGGQVPGAVPSAGGTSAQGDDG